MMRRLFLSVVVVMTFSVAASSGWTANTAATQKPDPISQQLDSKDPAQISQAVSTIQQQLQSSDPHAQKDASLGLARGGHWLKKLMDAGQYDAVNSLGLEAIVAVPSDLPLKWINTPFNAGFAGVVVEDVQCDSDLPRVASDESVKSDG